MAIELVTGHSGSAHVSGADAGAMHAGICGSDSYVLGAVPSVTMSDANTLAIQPCDLMVEGRHVRLSGTNTLSIRSGAQTGKRNDLVYVRYAYDSSTGVESARLGVKEGTTATTASDPALDNPSSVLDGATIADVAICRVSLDALTPTATWLLPQLPTLAALGDSVSRFAHVLYDGSLTYSVTLPHPCSYYDELIVEFETDWQWHARLTIPILDMTNGTLVSMWGFASGTTVQMAMSSCNPSGSTLAMGAERYINVNTTDTQFKYSNADSRHIYIRKVVGVVFPKA